jgi:D-aminoacyl-tRNA deacylase
MRLLIQRVLSARVETEGKIASIEKGALVFFAAHSQDKMDQIFFLANKLVHLRMFCDNADKMNLSLLDVKGAVLIVSQFTLYADCKKGNRPSFTETAPPPIANSYYEAFVQEVKKSGLIVETGIFGAKMQVHLINDGPVTLLIDAPY